MYVCSAYADKCAKLKDNVLRHLHDLNHPGMVEMWLQQLKEPMTEFVAVAYEIHSPVNKQELRVKVHRVHKVSVLTPNVRAPWQ